MDAARRRAGAHALARDGPAAGDLPRRRCTTPSCCCSTSRWPTSTRRRSSWSRRCRPQRPRRAWSPATTRSGGLAEADLALGLRGGRAGLRSPRRATSTRRRSGSCTGEERPRALAAQGAAAGAAHAASRCRRWRCSRVTTFVIFHFAARPPQPRGRPGRRRAVGDAAVRRHAGDQPPVRGRARAGRLRRPSCSPRSTARAARRQGDGAVLLPRRGRAGGRARPSPSSCSGPSPGPALPSCSACSLLADAGIAVVGTLVAALAIQTRARDLIVPLVALPLLVPVVIAAARGDAPLLLRGRCRSAPRQVAGGARPLRSGLRPARLRGLRLPPGGLSPPMYGKGLRTLSLATAATLTAAFALVFFYAPLDADQGFVQKIFYVHVPMAIVALCGFVAGGVMAIAHLRTGDRELGPALLRGDPPVARSSASACWSPARSGPRRRGATGGCGTSRRWSRS